MMNLIDHKDAAIIKLVNFYEQQDLINDYSFFGASDFEKIINFYLKSLNHPRAKEVAVKAIELFPYNFNLLLIQAELFIAFDHPDEALELLERADLVNPSDLKTHLLFADVFDQLGDLDEAIERLERALLFAETDKLLIYFKKGSLHAINDQLDKAIECYKKVLIIDFDNLDAIAELTNCFQLKGDVNGALSFYNKIIDKNPYSWKAWSNLAFIYQLLEQSDKELEAYEMSLAIDFKQTETWYKKAITEIEEGNYNKSIESLNECIKYGKTDSDVYIQLGLAHAYNEEFDKSENNFKIALEKDPKDSEAWFGLGLTFISRNDPFNALEYINYAIELNPQDEKYWLELANCYAMMDEVKAAEKAFKKSLEYNPLYIEAIIDFSLFLHDNLKTQRAIKKITDAILYQDDVPEFYALLAGFYYESGKNVQGNKNLQKAFLLDADSSTFFYEFFPLLQNNENISELMKKLRRKN